MTNEFFSKRDLTRYKYNRFYGPNALQVVKKLGVIRLAMQEQNKLKQNQTPNSAAKIQYYLLQIHKVETSLLQLRARKKEIFQRIDTLESKLQALSKKTYAEANDTAILWLDQ